MPLLSAASTRASAASTTTRRPDSAPPEIRASVAAASAEKGTVTKVGVVVVAEGPLQRLAAGLAALYPQTRAGQGADDEGALLQTKEQQGNGIGLRHHAQTRKGRHRLARIPGNDGLPQALKIGNAHGRSRSDR